MIEMILGLSIWSIVVIIVGVIITTALISIEFDDRYGPGTGWGAIISIILFLSAFISIEKIELSILSFLFDNIISFIIFLIIYIGIGIGWSFFRWYLFLIEHFENYGRDIVLSNYSRTIMMWICYWPLSMLGILITRPIKISFKFIYNNFTGVYQWILKSARKNVKKNLKRADRGDFEKID